MEDWQKKIKNIPDRPGVYIYKNHEGRVIYVGKAKRLIRRVKQYFQNVKDKSPKTVKLISEIITIDTFVTASEFDALLLEATLIRQWMPKYNVIAKDDKSLLYICLTFSETLPRLLLLRKPELAIHKKDKRNRIYGPFQSDRALRDLLSQLRHAIPYCMQKKRTGVPCFYTHIGLCDPCPCTFTRAKNTEETRKQIKRYMVNMRSFRDVFDGKTIRVTSAYTRLMNNAATNERFEDALVYKRRIDMLYNISSFKYDPLVFIEQGIDAVFDGELSELLGYLHNDYPHLQTLTRIECFDMSQLYGTSPVGAMVVLTDGTPDNKAYRKFRINKTGIVSDVSMMEEVLTRRFMHADWPVPSFILLDGGKAQLHTASLVFAKLNLSIPYAGLAKRFEELIVPTAFGYHTLRLPLTSKALHVLERVRDEAHRFAISYHKVLRDKRLTV